MDSPGCTLGLGLMLGVLIGALLVGGSAQWKSAMFKVKSVQTERKKYQEALTKAKGTRSQGYADLVVAAVLLLLGIAMLVVAVQLLSSAQAF